MDNIAQLIWVLLVLLLVTSSLISHRIPAARMVAWSAGWAVLFLGAYYLFDTIEPLVAKWQQSRRGGTITTVEPTISSQSKNSNNSGQTTTTGAGVTIPMRSDGHYWVDATINGQNVRFLVDSGASITALSQSTANELGLPPDPMNRTMVVKTANGDVAASRSVISTMQIGAIQASDIPVVVSESFSDINVLGMNFLNKLKSWRVENGNMILEPQ